MRLSNMLHSVCSEQRAMCTHHTMQIKLVFDGKHGIPFRFVAEFCCALRNYLYMVLSFRGYVFCVRILPTHIPISYILCHTEVRRIHASVTIYPLLGGNCARIEKAKPFYVIKFFVENSGLMNAMPLASCYLSVRLDWLIEWSDGSRDWN